MIRRNKIIVFISVGFLFLGSCALLNQKNKIEIETLSDDTAVKYAETITVEDLTRHLTEIASDAYEGRETAMPGQKKAAQYIENHFKNIGLQPGMGKDGFQQSFPVDLKDPKKVELYINGNRLNFLEDFFYLGNVNDTIFQDKEIVFLGYGIDQEGFSDYKNVNVKGKIVLVFEGIPEDSKIDVSWANWRNKLEAANKNGAVAMFTLQDNFEERVEQVRMFIENPRMQLHDKGNQQFKKSLPNIYISKDSFSKYANFDNKKGKILNEKSTIKIQISQVLYSENVLGFLEGTDLKDEIVVISAHYDHIGYDNGEICNGADDDGSGTVALMEIAEAFMKAKNEGKGPRRSILFLSVSGEEKGLLGSDYYTQNPVYPLENTVTNLNIDMIGRKDSLHDNDNYVYLIGADRISKDLHDISEKVNEKLIQMELDYTYNKESDPNHFYYRSDHYNFAKNGIPVIFYFSGVHEDYHKPTDDVVKILFPKLAKTTKLIFYTAWEIANRKERLRKNA